MFNKKEDVQYSKVTTLIGEGCQFEGVLRANGTLRIDGQLKGEVIIEGNLFVGEKGKIFGNVKVDNLWVAGMIKGNVDASNQLRVASSGSLFGDVNVKSFILDENAYYEGNCKMQKESSPMAEGL